MKVRISADLSDLYKLMIQPETLVGTMFSQAWESDGNTERYIGTILKSESVKNTPIEFTVQYNGEADTCVLTVDEFL